MRIDRNHIKNAELLSLIGACAASGGIALLLQAWLEPFKLLLLFGGLSVHAAAMFYRQRLERSAGTEFTIWERSLYWGCWIILAIMVFYMLAAGSNPFSG